MRQWNVIFFLNVLFFYPKLWCIVVTTVDSYLEAI